MNPEPLPRLEEIALPEGQDVLDTPPLDLDALISRDPRELSMAERLRIVESLREQRHRWLQAEAAGKRTTTRTRKPRGKKTTAAEPTAEPELNLDLNLTAEES